MSMTGSRESPSVVEGESVANLIAVKKKGLSNFAYTVRLDVRALTTSAGMYIFQDTLILVAPY